MEFKIGKEKKVVRYTWRSEVKQTGIDRTRRVSNWEESETCDCCGKKIVHIFLVDGKVFGYNCLKETYKMESSSFYKSEFLREQRSKKNRMSFELPYFMNREFIPEGWLFFSETIEGAVELFLDKRAGMDHTSRKYGVLVIKREGKFAGISDCNFRFPKGDFEFVGVYMPNK